MKKLLITLMAVLSLCACSSNDDSSVSNQFLYDGKVYQIDSAYINHYVMILYSGEYHRFSVTTARVEIGKKNFLKDLGSEAILCEYDKDGNEGYLHLWGSHGSKMDKNSYLTIKNNDEDDRTYIEVYINDGEKPIKATYLGVARKE
uniref:hypothetical protein n=1 Tax=Prevotella sp. TaxID=59823 RepID=UPI0025F107DE